MIYNLVSIIAIDLSSIMYIKLNNLLTYQSEIISFHIRQFVGKWNNFWLKLIDSNVVKIIIFF